MTAHGEYQIPGDSNHVDWILFFEADGDFTIGSKDQFATFEFSPAQTWELYQYLHQHQDMFKP